MRVRAWGMWRSGAQTCVPSDALRIAGVASALSEGALVAGNLVAAPAAVLEARLLCQIASKPFSPH